ncbi:MAG: response regulator [Methanospirillum sp.]|uniref:response regulator n=1 Tax=Methanospirillum sp. TaxID=45200 RepID=UPI00236BA922|nr:response regulator [Methanospirillum sp.]MDD1727732.1 response regulator [Methanospirillum sp.]
MKILLIDDNATLVQMYQRILTTGERQIEIETDSSKAIGTIKSVRPDVILLDLMMEPVSGWEVLDLIRSDEEIADLPVLILTGKMMTAEEAVRYGMKIDGFVMKPLERTMLVAVVDEVWEIICECEERYKKALAAGLSEEKAKSCQQMIRKRRMLTYLKELLNRQEKMVNLRPDEKSNLSGSIEELRQMIATELMDLAQEEMSCP